LNPELPWKINIKKLFSPTHWTNLREETNKGRHLLHKLDGAEPGTLGKADHKNI
jgi:hypothetical protein